MCGPRTPRTVAAALGCLFAGHGSLRVVAVIAEHLGLVSTPSLPRPIRGLSGEVRARIIAVLEELELGA